jgi:hypothetical protein
MKKWTQMTVNNEIKERFKAVCSKQRKSMSEVIAKLMEGYVNANDK